MQILKEFLNSNELSTTRVYKDLGLSLDEALMLRFLCKAFLDGDVEVGVSSLLSEVYGKETSELLDKIGYIKSLVSSSHLVYAHSSQLFGNDFLDLEVLNLNIALSSNFLEYLQFGYVKKPISEEISPYTDHLQYLQDQFLRMECYQKLALSKGEFNSQKVQEKIKELEDKIEKRIQVSSIKLKVEELFSKHELSKHERIIFLALLREEYVGEMDSFRELNSLISLVSKDNYEKIKNRTLLDDDSKLISNSLIDYDEILTGFGGISRSFFVGEEVLGEIMYPNKNKKEKKLTLDALVKDQEIFELVRPTTSLDDVVMHPKTRELMDVLLKQVDKKVVTRLKKWGIKKSSQGIDAKVLLYGPPGTGKTMTANSLAKSLKKQILSFDCSKILSKYVGESEQNVRKIFDTYKDICAKSKSAPILLLNEADQFLSSRTEVAGGGADKMHNQMQNIFLEQIEKFDGILVATTNFLESLDKAFSRRFDYKIEFKKPDFKQRLELWRKLLPVEATYEEDFSLEKLAKHPLSGGQIVVVLKNTALKVAIKEEAIFTQEDFNTAIQRELKGAFGDEKLVGFVS